MRLRWQFSLSMLMLLTVVVSAVVAFIVMPWRERLRQQAIIARLEDNPHNETFFLYLYRNDAGQYGVGGVDTPEEFEFLVQHMQDSSLIRSIRLENHCATVEGVAKLRNLPNLEELVLSIARLDEPTMQALQQLPLKRLEIDGPEKADFRTWPIQPRLESFRIQVNQEQMDIPSLKLVGHANLQFLDVLLYGYSVDSLTAFSEVTVQDCPQLESLEVSIGNSRAPCRFQIEKLPLLKKLALSAWPLAAENSIGALPLVEELRVDSDFIPFLTNVLGNKNLQVTCNNSSTPMKAEELNQLLQYRNIRQLDLMMGWECFDETRAVIPMLTGLQILKFHNHYAANGAETKPVPYLSKKLAIRFLEQAPNVEALVLMVDHADEELITKIASLEKLSELHLMVHGDCASLLPLRERQGLYLLYFSQITMNQAFLDELAHLDSLTTLAVSTKHSTELNFSKLLRAQFKKLSFNGRPVVPSPDEQPTLP